MSPAFAAEVAGYEAWHPLELGAVIVQMEADLAFVQSKLAAARKAQKNQKRAAKKELKVVE